jgi:hypothetical protein
MIDLVRRALSQPEILATTGSTELVSISSLVKKSTSLGTSQGKESVLDSDKARDF